MSGSNHPPTKHLFMKQFITVVVFIFAGFSLVHAQQNGKKKIAIFAPLYLDSAFSADGEYRYPSNSMPKFITPGLEFYQGAQLALDSLSQTGVQLDVTIYDTRARWQSVDDQLDKTVKNGTDLIIAHCSNNELRSFADKARENKIPVINVNLPNDGGVSNNPYFVVLNPTLKTQTWGLYDFIKKNYGGSNKQIVFFKKKNNSEAAIKTMFEDAIKNTPGSTVKIKYIDLIDSFTVNQLKAQLDSNKQNICIVGSFDINFGNRLIKQLASFSKQYKSVAVGMPTWENLKDLSKPEYKGVEIVYSNPFHNAKTDKLSQNINQYFTQKMFARPSDMVFRGYEVTWKFAKLLQQYGNDFNANLTNKNYQLFTDFDIQPVLDNDTMTLEYLENKKLYFVKWMDGIVKQVL